MKQKIIQTFLILMLVFGYVLMTLPTVSDQYSRIGQTASIGSYENAVNNLSEEEADKIWEACAAYNEKIYQQQIEEYYHFSDTLEYSEDYMSFPSNGSDIGTLIIPSIDVQLPIGHGTAESVLQIKVGHLYGTSLPCGTGNSHAVVSGHSGLKSSKMFDNLEDLTYGDKVYVKMLNKVLEYMVTEINVVIPEEHDRYMQIEEGKDLLTLYTCTPYGINTHRLLVKCEFNGISDVEVAEQNNNVTLSVDSNKPYVMIGIIWGIPWLLCGILIAHTWLHKDKSKKKCKTINSTNTKEPSGVKAVHNETSVIFKEEQLQPINKEDHKEMEE